MPEFQRSKLYFSVCVENQNIFSLEWVVSIRNSRIPWESHDVCNFRPSSVRLVYSPLRTKMLHFMQLKTEEFLKSRQFFFIFMPVNLDGFNLKLVSFAWNFQLQFGQNVLKGIFVRASKTHQPYFFSLLGSFRDRRSCLGWEIRLHIGWRVSWCKWNDNPVKAYGMHLGFYIDLFMFQLASSK